MRYAPRTWRCFSLSFLHFIVRQVCSTHVEMFLDAPIRQRWPSGMLHARGDVSDAAVRGLYVGKYAPRTWRCFHLEVFSRAAEGVCSTHVEMFLPFMTSLQTCRSMLHARGDVSMRLWIDRHILVYAPRTWRCFYRVLCLRVR